MRRVMLVLTLAMMSTPEKVARIWAEEWSKEGWQIDWQKLLPRRGFEVLPRRWVVERTFFVTFPEPADEQGLREAVRDRRIVRLRGDGSTHGKAVSPCLGLFGQFLSDSR